MDERLYPIGSYYLGYRRNLNVETLLGFGRWELQDVRTPSGAYLYKRID